MTDYLSKYFRMSRRKRFETMNSYITPVYHRARHPCLECSATTRTISGMSIGGSHGNGASGAPGTGKAEAVSPINLRAPVSNLTLLTPKRMMSDGVVPQALRMMTMLHGTNRLHGMRQVRMSHGSCRQRSSFQSSCRAGF